MSETQRKTAKSINNAQAVFEMPSHQKSKFIGKIYDEQRISRIA
jgi:hypothetical protein